MNNAINNKERDYLLGKFKVYRGNLYQYTAELLKLVNKDAQLVSFSLNRAQQYIHKCIETQRKQKGFVRVIVLKGRQQGSSKYFNARFLRNCSLFENQSAYIMAHDSATTASLFEDCKKLYNSLPMLPVIKPKLKANNARILEFNEINSKITVGTAGSAEVGRGTTINKFHGSEVAFWPNGDNILAGVLQAVPLTPGTEVCLESTANGMGNKFYSMCMDAIEGKGVFQLIFIPWWWTAEYYLEDFSFIPTDEEIKYFDNYMSDFFDGNLDEACPFLNWRRNKIVELGEKKFKQEYPATPMEAFQMSGSNLFSIDAVKAAMKCDFKESRECPLVIGVDAAERGGDRTAICLRRGRQVERILTWDDMDEMRLAGIIGQLINKEKPIKVFVDKAYGNGCIARLHELGYGNIVKAVHFGSASSDTAYLNKRAEMHYMAKKWLEDGLLEGGGKKSTVSIPESEELLRDLMAIPEVDPSSNGRLKIIDKRDIRKELKLSPDLLDSFILTFAEPVVYHNRRGSGYSQHVKIANQSITQKLMKG